MKAILFLALLAFAASAFNSTVYHEGFADRLGLSPTATADGFTCIDAVQSAVSAAIQLFQQPPNDILDLIVDVNTVVTQFRQEVKQECYEYMDDLYFYIANNTEGVTYEDMSANFYKYHPQILQKIGFYADALVDGNDYLAGRIEGWILQVLVGIVKPTVTFKNPQINFTNSVPMDIDKFYAEFFPAYLSGFGVTKQSDIDVFIRCSQSSGNLTTTILQDNYLFDNGGDFPDQASYIKSDFNAFIDVIDNCVQAFEVEREIFAPLYSAFFNNPGLFTLRMIRNILIHFPAIEYHVMQEVVDVNAGEYAAAGKAEFYAARDIIGGLSEV